MQSNCDEKFKIEKMSINDIDLLVNLHAKYLNYGEGVRAHFEAALNDNSTVATKCVCDGEMIGIDIYTSGISLSGDHPDILKMLEMKTLGRVVYTADALFVKESFRKMGATEMLRLSSKDALVKKGAEVAIHELWVHPDGSVPAFNVVKSFSSTEFIGRFKMFYENFHHYGYFCTMCKGVCQCSADIYITQIP